MSPYYTSVNINGCFHFTQPTVEGQEEEQYSPEEGYSADQYSPAAAYQPELGQCLYYKPHTYPYQPYVPHGFIQPGYFQPCYPALGFSPEGCHPDQSFGQVYEDAPVGEGRQKSKKQLKKLQASVIGGRVGRAIPHSLVSSVTAKAAEEVNRVYEKTHKSIEDDRKPSADGIEDSATEEVAVPKKENAQAAENPRDSQLTSFGELVKKSKGVRYLRQDYRDKIAHSIANPMEFSGWEDATFHNPPREMLENIRKIAYKHALLGDKQEATYLFPMTLVISKIFQDRNWDPVSAEDSLKKDKITINASPYFLELGFKDGRALHVFVRSLDTNRGRALPKQVRNFMMNRHNESILAIGDFQDDMKPSNKEPMKETESHFAFKWSLDIVVISPKRK